MGLFQQPDQKVDIFGQPGQEQQGQQGGGGSSAPGGAKTSTEGQIGSSSGSGTTSAGESANPTDIITPAAAAMRKNADKATGPQAVGKAQTDIGAAEAGLQNEANQYVQGYATKDYGLEQGAVDKAVAGDTEAYGKTLSRLRNQSAPQVDKFAAKTDTEIEDIPLMGTDAGLKQLMRREAGDQYNAGEGAFDTGLLRRNNQFNLTLDQLRRRQEALSGQAADYQTTKSNEAQTAAQTGYDTATQGIRGTLAQREGETVAAAQQRAAEENAQRAALRSKANQALIDQESQAGMQGARSQLGTLNNRALQFLDPALADANQFYKVGGDVGENDAYTDDQAGQFNRIQGLLGTGKNVSAGTFSPREQYDKAGYEKALIDKAVGKRSEADAGLDNEYKSIMDMLDKRTTDYNNSWDKQGLQNTQSDAAHIKNQLADQYGSWVQQLDVDPMKFVDRKKSASRDQMIGEDDAKKLNKNREDRGADQRFKAGGTGGQAYGFDVNRYKSVLEDAIKGAVGDDAEARAKREGGRTVPYAPISYDQVNQINGALKNLDKWEPHLKVSEVASRAVHDSEGLKSTLDKLMGVEGGAEEGAADAWRGAQDYATERGRNIVSNPSSGRW